MNCKFEEQLEQIGRHIFVNSRNELYLKMRFLDVALSAYQFVMDTSIGTAGTDGCAVYYDPRYIGGLFREDRVSVNRLYLHMVLHGVFRHIVRRKERNIRIYNLACDIAAESVIDGMSYPCVNKGRSWIRREVYRRLEKNLSVLSADKVYEELMRWNLDERELLRAEEDFCADSHRYWPQDDEKKKQQIEKKWQEISEYTETDMETFSEESSAGAGHFIDQIKVENREKADYRRFLRKFSVLKEEMQVDEDTFDYAFYSYGLQLYGNMPLIEPQEWKEVQKIEEFVIVIDTSMSCSRELVKNFLRETYTILKESDSFFRKVNIHILQCDEKVQSDQKITNEKELREYMENMQLFGEGGTDFRPAFEYVEKLRKEHVFMNLKGMLYFTDGKGIYPKQMPCYETAFVFMQKDYEDAEVPPWAMKVILEEEDFI